MENVKNKELMNELVERLFPRRKQYLLNSMTPTVIDGPDGRKIAMLVIGDDLVEEYLWAHEGIPEIRGTLYLEENKYKIGKDLIISFIVACDAGTLHFETNVQGDERKAQLLIMDVLSKPTEVGIFVVNQSLDIVALLKADFNPEHYQDLFGYFGIEA
ncbi:hypothetical protein JR334_05395 [Clostridia bacterium]|nr:hypothetical protein JR334_05395 [Clostridia bacterium]